jgi:hypothetical protein
MILSFSPLGETGKGVNTKTGNGKGGKYENGKRERGDSRFLTKF